jgi:rhodanese-related sulfurtransferase
MNNRLLADITVEDAHALLNENTVLIDVREPHEHAIERIPGAIALPLSRLANGGASDVPQDRTVVFLCASGMRTKTNSAALASLASGEAFCMTGGILAWKRAGFPTDRG